MTRGQRRLHRLVWFLLGPLLIAVLVWSLVARQEYPRIDLPPAVEEGK